MSVFLTAFVVWILYTSSFAQNLCITPNGENGRCILFEHCDAFTSIWTKRTHKVVHFVRNSHCGYQRDKPLVCCGTVAEYTDFSNNSSTMTTPTTTTTTTITTTTTTTTQQPVPITTQQPVTTTPEPMTTPELVTRVEPITSNPIPVTSASVTMTTTPQLFTSAILTSTPPATRSIPLSSTRIGYERHQNYNLIPRYGKCGLQIPAQRIIMGNETGIDEFPWLAMILYRREGMIVPNCGGSLINSKYILTAAHCIRANMVAVRLGEHDLRSTRDCEFQEGVQVCADPPQEFQIENFFIHPRYNRSDPSRQNDLALIRLKGEANITDFVKPICLPLQNERAEPSEKLSVAGWGLTEKNESSPVKLTVEVPVWIDMVCQEVYRLGFEVSISSRQLCAGGAVDEKDSCGGDSGGPLMRTIPGRVEYYIEAVVSFGPIKCGMRGIPGVYVRVAEYVQWILDTIMP